MPFDEIVESSAPVLEPIPIEDLGGIAEPDILSWSWPRLLPSAYHTFVVLEGAESTLFLYELTLNAQGLWEGVHIGAIGTLTDIDCVDVVDFGDYYILLVVGTTTRNFAKVIGGQLVELSQPLFAAACNYNGQLLGGNISHWHDLGSDGIVWSGIGSLEYNPEIDITSGFKTLVSGKIPGKRVTIKRMLPYMDGVIVYTDFGNVFLTDHLVGDSFVYGLDALEGIGVASSNHVAGNSFTQMFVNLNNELCKYQKSKEIKILGYKRHVEELKEAGTPLLMSFLEDRNTFFLSNGVATLVINDYGAGMIHQAVSGIVKGWNQIVYATFRDFGDREARITLDANSMDSRGKKTLEWLIVDINHHPDTRVMGSTYWRNSASDTWRDHAWKSGSPSGEFFIGLSAVEYRVALRFSQYEASEIFGVKVNMKYPDARTRRGLAAISGVHTRGNTETSA